MQKYKKSFLFRYPAFFASVVFVATLTAWFFIARQTHLHDQERFQNYVEQIRHQIDFRMETYVNALSQTRSMFDVKRNVTRQDFAKYIESLNILNDYPGIQGIGYTIKILPENLFKHIQEVRAEGFNDYKVWPDNPRDVYFSIIFLEPFDWRNQRAFGYDMYSNDIRKKAMDKAMLSGNAAISDRVELVQETEEGTQPGFLIYVPFYKDKNIPASINERAEKLAGFIYSPFRAYDLFNEIFSHLETSIPLNVIIYNIESSGQILPLFNFKKKLVSSNYKPRFNAEINLNVAQGHWKIKFASLPSFEDKTRHFPTAILVLGILISLLVYWILHKQSQYSQQEETRAAQLEIINDVGRKLAAELELEKLAQTVVSLGMEIAKAQYAAFFLKEEVNDDSSIQQKIFTYKGASGEDFQGFILPEQMKRTTLVEDITVDVRFGKNLPYQHIKTGSLLVKSFLSVPIVSRTGDFLGTLFLGHKEPAMFGEHEKILIEGIAAHTAIGIENAIYFKKANDAIEVRDEFLSVASHELKTPITSLKLLFQMTDRLIVQGNEKVFERDEVIKRVKKAVTLLDRMNALIEEMLDSARASVSQLNVKKEKLDMNVVTNEVIDRFKEQLEGQNINYTFSACPYSPVILGDNYRLEQVISNLINNAIKYGDGKAIAVDVSKREGRVYVSVQDHGIGIPSEKLSKIFERYERAGRGGSISGLGLGLYISRNIVQAHGGKISVESKVGQGSTFTLALPAA